MKNQKVEGDKVRWNDGKKICKTFSIDNELSKKLEHLAVDLGVNYSTLAEKAIRNFLENEGAKVNE